MSSDHQNTAEHLTETMIAKYRAKTLPPRELVSVTRHLAACPTCRRLAVRGTDANRLVSALGPEHLTFEQLESLVRTPAAASSGEFLEHITFCRTCAAELADLRAFRATLGLPERKGRDSALRFLIPAAAFAIVLITFTGLQFLKKPDSAPAPVQPAIVVSLQDANHVVSLDAAGQLRGVDGLSEPDRADVAAALQTGTLPVQADLKDLRRTRETLLSGETASASANPGLVALGPAGSVVGADRPMFRWKAPAGAKSFRVAVFDTDFNPVAESPQLAGSTWQPEKPLARGKTYIWTVTGTIGGVQVTAPQSPEPEARFRVADAATAQEMAALAKTSELAFVLGAWKRGMREEAESALQNLREGNTGSKELARIAAGMASGR